MSANFCTSFHCLPNKTFPVVPKLLIWFLNALPLNILGLNKSKFVLPNASFKYDLANCDLNCSWAVLSLNSPILLSCSLICGLSFIMFSKPSIPFALAAKWSALNKLSNSSNNLVNCFLPSEDKSAVP